MHATKQSKIDRIIRHPVAPSARPQARSTGKGLMGGMQHWLKQYPRLYDRLLKIAAPVQSSPRLEADLAALLAKCGDQDVVLNIGSGPAHFRGREDFINVDMFDFSNVDVTADAADLPFADNCADVVVNVAMLEHVRNPNAVVAEMFRVLKPNGTVFCFIPFLQPFHSAPSDFTRWTIAGAASLFENFSSVRVDIAAGPASAWLWATQEFLSLALSFGSQRAKDIIFLLLMAVTFPFKYLDRFLCSHPSAHVLASGFYVLATK